MAVVWLRKKLVLYLCEDYRFHFSYTCVGVLQKMLVFEPGKRIPAKKALEHPYFNDVRKEMH